jgi:5-hydroxyisourate hydrolase
MSGITTHVLDTSRGRPATGLAVALERLLGDSATAIGGGVTDADGRVRRLVADGESLPAGRYRLSFDTAAWFASERVETFYPRVVVEFEIREGEGHYHVPLLLSPHGYTTYRGS